MRGGKTALPTTSQRGALAQTRHEASSPSVAATGQLVGACVGVGCMRRGHAPGVAGPEVLCPARQQDAVHCIEPAGRQQHAAAAGTQASWLNQGHGSAAVAAAAAIEASVAATAAATTAMAVALAAARLVVAAAAPTVAAGQRQQRRHAAQGAAAAAAEAGSPAAASASAALLATKPLGTCA